MKKKLYSLKEVSKLLNRSVQTIKRAIKNNKIKAVKEEYKSRYMYYLSEEDIREYARVKKINFNEGFFKKEEKIRKDEKPSHLSPEPSSKVQDDISKDKELSLSYEKLLHQNKALLKQLEEANSELETQKLKEASTLSSQNNVVKEKEKLESFLKEIEEAMLQMTEQYKELAEQTKERDRKLEHLNNILNIKDEEIEQLRQELEELIMAQKESGEVKLMYEEQNIEYENTKAEREALQNQINEVEHVILQMTEQYKSLANQTYERDKKIEALGKELEERNKFINLQETALKTEKNRDWWDKILGN